MGHCASSVGADGVGSEPRCPKCPTGAPCSCSQSTQPARFGLTGKRRMKANNGRDSKLSRLNSLCIPRRGRATDSSRPLTERVLGTSLLPPLVIPTRRTEAVERLSVSTHSTAVRPGTRLGRTSASTLPSPAMEYGLRISQSTTPPCGTAALDDADALLYIAAPSQSQFAVEATSPSSDCPAADVMCPTDCGSITPPLDPPEHSSAPLAPPFTAALAASSPRHPFPTFGKIHVANGGGGVRDRATESSIATSTRSLDRRDSRHTGGYGSVVSGGAGGSDVGSWHYGMARGRACRPVVVSGSIPDHPICELGDANDGDAPPAARSPPVESKASHAQPSSDGTRGSGERVSGAAHSVSSPLSEMRGASYDSGLSAIIQGGRRASPSLPAGDGVLHVAHTPTRTLSSPSLGGRVKVRGAVCHAGRGGVEVCSDRNGSFDGCTTHTRTLTPTHAGDEGLSSPASSVPHPSASDPPSGPEAPAAAPEISRVHSPVSMVSAAGRSPSPVDAGRGGEGDCHTRGGQSMTRTACESSLLVRSSIPLPSQLAGTESVAGASGPPMAVQLLTPSEAASPLSPYLSPHAAQFGTAGCACSAASVSEAVSTSTTIASQAQSVTGTACSATAGSQPHALSYSSVSVPNFSPNSSNAGYSASYGVASQFGAYGASVAPPRTSHVTHQRALSNSSLRISSHVIGGVCGMAGGVGDGGRAAHGARRSGGGRSSVDLAGGTASEHVVVEGETSSFCAPPAMPSRSLRDVSVAMASADASALAYEVAQLVSSTKAVTPQRDVVRPSGAVESGARGVGQGGDGGNCVHELGAPSLADPPAPTAVYASPRSRASPSLHSSSTYLPHVLEGRGDTAPFRNPDVPRAQSFGPMHEMSSHVVLSSTSSLQNSRTDPRSGNDVATKSSIRTSSCLPNSSAAYRGHSQSSTASRPLAAGTLCVSPAGVFLPQQSHAEEVVPLSGAVGVGSRSELEPQVPVRAVDDRSRNMTPSPRVPTRGLSSGVRRDCSTSQERLYTPSHLSAPSPSLTRGSVASSVMRGQVGVRSHDSALSGSFGRDGSPQQSAQPISTSPQPSSLVISSRPRVHSLPMVSPPAIERSLARPLVSQEVEDVSDGALPTPDRSLSLPPASQKLSGIAAVESTMSFSGPEAVGLGKEGVSGEHSSAFKPSGASLPLRHTSLSPQGGRGVPHGRLQSSSFTHSGTLPRTSALSSPSTPADGQRRRGEWGSVVTAEPPPRLTSVMDRAPSAAPSANTGGAESSKTDSQSDGVPFRCDSRASQASRVTMKTAMRPPPLLLPTPHEGNIASVIEQIPKDPKTQPPPPDERGNGDGRSRVSNASEQRQ